MSAIIREGLYGSYYGNSFTSSNALTTEQMKLNATYIYNYLTAKGWTVNAISALLGNMQAESSINPGRWQSDSVGGDSSGHGYGLVQWTPYTKYTEWIVQNGFADPSEMDANLYRLIYEVENKIQWYGVGIYQSMTFEDFTKSTDPVNTLATAFLLCYERPADQSTQVQQYRGSLATNWYVYLTGVTPTPARRKKKKGYKFILFNRRSQLNG